MAGLGYTESIYFIRITYQMFRLSKSKILRKKRHFPFDGSNM